MNYLSCGSNFVSFNATVDKNGVLYISKKLDYLMRKVENKFNLSMSVSGNYKETMFKFDKDVEENVLEYILSFIEDN